MAFPQKITKMTQDIGKAGVNALFPNDFEYYAVTLELTDSQGDTIEYLTFPVSPDSMKYDDRSLMNVKKTMSGVSALDNETFNPKNIELTGTFGRKFKILLNNEIGDINIQKSDGSTAKGVYQATKANVMSIKQAVFDPKLKTGYGTIKILEAIINKSKGYDEYNMSHKLYLYNPALGHNWLIKAASVTFSQDRTGSNMLWQYNLQLSVLAPMDQVRAVSVGNRSLPISTGIASLQSNLNTLTSKIRSSF